MPPSPEPPYETRNLPQPAADQDALRDIEYLSDGGWRACARDVIYFLRCNGRQMEADALDMTTHRAQHPTVFPLPPVEEERSLLQRVLTNLAAIKNSAKADLENKKQVQLNHLLEAVYGRAQLNDLCEAVRRLPSLFEGPEAPAMKATGTDGAVFQGADSQSVQFARRFAQTNDSVCQDMRAGEDGRDQRSENTIGPKPLALRGVGADCDDMRLTDRSSPSRTRTYNKPVNSRLLYH